MFTLRERAILAEILIAYLQEGFETKITSEMQNIADKLELTEKDKESIYKVTGLIVK